MNLGTATVLYNCFMPEVDVPLADLERRQILEDQKVVMVSVLICWSDQQSLGSKITPRYLYNKIGAWGVLRGEAMM